MSLLTSFLAMKKTTTGKLIPVVGVFLAFFVCNFVDNIMSWFYQKYIILSTFKKSNQRLINSQPLICFPLFMSWSYWIVQNPLFRGFFVIKTSSQAWKAVHKLLSKVLPEASGRPSICYQNGK